MKLTNFVITGVLILCCWALPVWADNPAPTKAGIFDNQEQIQPLKTYFLNVLPGGIRQSLKFDSPVTKFVVSSQSGDTAIRFGDGKNIYVSKPGNPQQICADISHPIAQLWAENSHEQPVRLRVDVYAVSSPSESVPKSLDTA